MDEKQFKKHLAALAHGHHHPEEHDWDDDTRTAPDIDGGGDSGGASTKAAKSRKPAKSKAAKPRARKK